MLRVGQTWTHTAYIGTGSNWSYGGHGTFYQFDVLSSDSYFRSGGWNFAHIKPGGMEPQSYHSRGMARGGAQSYDIPGDKYYDYSFSRNDGSAEVIKDLTVCDPRHSRAVAPFRD